MVCWSEGEASTEPSLICVSYDLEPRFAKAANSATRLPKGASSL
jgi:hypothetical protein